MEVNDKEEYIPFIDTLEAFEEVVETCFGFEYNEQYEEKIELFEKSWMHLKEEFGITIPNKCHIIFTHVKDYILPTKCHLEVCQNRLLKLAILSGLNSYKIRNLDG